MCSFIRVRISTLKENEKTKGGAVEKMKRASLFLSKKKKEQAPPGNSKPASTPIIK